MHFCNWLYQNVYTNERLTLNEEEMESESENEADKVRNPYSKKEGKNVQTKNIAAHNNFYQNEPIEYN